MAKKKKDKNAAKKQAISKKIGKAPAKKKKAGKISVPKIIVHIKATYNNTVAVATDYDGNVVASSSCGQLGFKGSRKSTVYAATKVGEDLAHKASGKGAKEAEVIVQGIGVGRQATVKGVRAGGLRITSLADHTPVAHGGCKPRRQPKK